MAGLEPAISALMAQYPNHWTTPATVVRVVGLEPTQTATAGDTLALFTALPIPAQHPYSHVPIAFSAMRSSGHAYSTTRPSPTGYSVVIRRYVPGPERIARTLS